MGAGLGRDVVTTAGVALGVGGRAAGWGAAWLVGTARRLPPCKVTMDVGAARGAVLAAK